MRLTLRTMLACLDADDRLDPVDAEELNTKIDQSKHATELAQRIRRVVQHPRLNSPRLDGKGMGLDPNSIAEYLDNVLPHDRIGEFERVCLQSDVQLAEVAACHQILVLVLEQPAEIEPPLRDRIYHMAAESSRRTTTGATSQTLPGPDGTNVRIDRPATTSPATSTATAVESAPTPKPAPEVPDYLRAGRKPSLWPLALAALLAFAVVGIGLRAMGPLDRHHPMAAVLGLGDKEVADVGNNSGENPPPIVPSDTVPADVPDDQKQPIDDPTLPVNPSEEDPELVPPKTALEPRDDKKTALPDETLPPLDPTDNTPPKTTPQVPVDPPVDPPVPSDTDPKPMEPMPLEPRPPVVGDTTPQPPLDPPVPAADVGRFVSEDQVLVRRNAMDQQFARVPARASVFVGDELLVLPAYRPQLLLATNVQMTIAGESRLRLGMNDAEGVPQVSIEFGRVLLASVGKPNTKVRLNLAGIQGQVILADVDSEVGIEVRDYLPPGANPQTLASVEVIRLYTTRGKAAWQEGPADAPGDTFPIQQGEARNYVGDTVGATAAISSPPDWIDGKNISDIDRRAAHDVEQKLAIDKPLELTLNELASEMERRAELRSLAIRSLALMDKFEPFVSAFNDENQRAYWTAEYDVLRDAVARDPDTATKVRAALEKLRGAEAGAQLFRMLWGYSPDDLKTVEMPLDLVRYLDVEALDQRVFAYENLRRITGSTQLYQPQFNAARRRTPVAQWNARLKAGEIVYKVPPGPITDVR